MFNIDFAFRFGELSMSAKARKEKSVTLEALLKTMIKRGATDLHLVPGSPPRLRKDGKIVPVSKTPLTAAETEMYSLGLLNEDQKKRFATNKSINISFGISGLARFRASLYYQKGSICGAFKEIIKDIMPAQQLELPSTFFELLDKRLGLMLITGPAGSGKSTVWASAIDFLNERKSLHIRTIEDPISFLFQHKKSMVTQVEIASDVPSVRQALAAAQEHNADVVGISDLDSLDAFTGALELAESGVLVIGCAQASSCQSCVNNLLDLVPDSHTGSIRNSLARNLVGITCQYLLPKKDGQGRVLAMELLVATPDVQQMIRNDTQMLYSLMDSGTAGMQTKDQALLELYKKDRIDFGTAFDMMDDPAELIRAG